MFSPFDSTQGDRLMVNGVHNEGSRTTHHDNFHGFKYMKIYKNKTAWGIMRSF